MTLTANTVSDQDESTHAYRSSVVRVIMIIIE
jgi:hypothetical protein